MKDYIVLRIIAKFLTPFILLFAFYIQLHGEYSPGGGFQAGVIFAAAFILFCMIYGQKDTLKILNIDELRLLAAFGVLLYAGVGVAALLMGGEFLNYSVLLEKQTAAQQLGIITIELGVGITVAAVMLLLFHVFVARKG